VAGAFIVAPHLRGGATRACAVRQFEGDRFVVCRFDAVAHELRLATLESDGAALRSLSNLRRMLGVDAKRVRFAMNAGMFNDAGGPIGLYVERGETLHDIQMSEGPGNFHLMPNGVFSLDAADVVRVETSADFVARGGGAVWATQSGPMLVIDGALHPSIQNDGESRLVRNGVGAPDSRHAIFVISNSAVSFGKLARLFRDELGCANALFLDGTVSNIWAPELGRMDRGRRLGPFIVVLDRADP
jgi:uncharacterized protein YigE (DUF2233 family)